MQRSLVFAIAVCSALAIGCGGPPADLSKAVQASTTKSTYPNKQNAETQTTPEFIASHTETSVERAKYLKELASDAKFDPKEHVEMLKKYEADPDADVASAAKELLAKAQ